MGTVVDAHRPSLPDVAWPASGHFAEGLDYLRSYHYQQRETSLSNDSSSLRHYLTGDARPRFFESRR